MTDLTPDPAALPVVKRIYVNQPQQFRLGSSPAVHAPGIVVWARSLALTDPDKAAQIVSDGWSIPLWAAEDLVLGRSAYTTEGETVVFPVDAI